MQRPMQETGCDSGRTHLPSSSDCGDSRPAVQQVQWREMSPRPPPRREGPPLLHAAGEPGAVVGATAAAAGSGSRRRLARQEEITRRRWRVRPHPPTSPSQRASTTSPPPRRLHDHAQRSRYGRELLESAVLCPGASSAARSCRSQRSFFECCALRRCLEAAHYVKAGGQKLSRLRWEVKRHEVPPRLRESPARRDGHPEQKGATTAADTAGDTQCHGGGKRRRCAAARESPQARGLKAPFFVPGNGTSCLR
jgi:hypothetical protein